MWIELKLPLVTEKSVARFMDQREYITVNYRQQETTDIIHACSTQTIS